MFSFQDEEHQAPIAPIVPVPVAPVVPVAKAKRQNGIKTQPTAADDQFVTKKNRTRKVESKKVEAKKTDTKKIEAKKPESKKKPPPKKKRISPITSKLNATDPGILHNLKRDTAKSARNTNVEHSTTGVSSMESDASATSTGSIEKRLSEIISPSNSTVEKTNNRTGQSNSSRPDLPQMELGKMLADILNQSGIGEAPNEEATTNVCDNNSSTHSIPSPVFENIIEIASASNYDPSK